VPVAEDVNLVHRHDFSAKLLQHVLRVLDLLVDATTFECEEPAARADERNREPKQLIHPGNGARGNNVVGTLLVQFLGSHLMNCYVIEVEGLDDLCEPIRSAFHGFYAVELEVGPQKRQNDPGKPSPGSDVGHCSLRREEGSDRCGVQDVASP